MINVRMEKECGCFKRSGIESVKSFENKEDALSEAQAWCEEMNETFCQKHNFSFSDEGEEILIKVEMN
jgi:hypothetical protein